MIPLGSFAYSAVRLLLLLRMWRLLHVVLGWPRHSTAISGRGQQAK